MNINELKEFIPQDINHIRVIENVGWTIDNKFRTIVTRIDDNNQDIGNPEFIDYDEKAIVNDCTPIVTDKEVNDEYSDIYGSIKELVELYKEQPTDRLKILFEEIRDLVICSKAKEE